MDSIFDPKILQQLFKAQFKIETNVSELYFTSKYVYKIKKPVNLGFVDFTNSKNRNSMTLKEFKINKKISPKIYLKLIPIKIYKNKIILNGKGRIEEYAIKMIRLPQAGELTNLLKKKRINKNLIASLATIFAQLHAKFKPHSLDAKYGEYKIIKQNFDQVLRLIKSDAFPIFISKNDFEKFSSVTLSFLKSLQPVFKQRIQKHRIQMIHGDLHSENIFIYKQKPVITDAVLPIDNWIYGDVAIDVAALAMDLDAYGFKNFSDLFVSLYAQKKHDATLEKVVPFYKISWAAIRFWVNSLAAKNNKREALPKVKLYKKILLEYLSKI
ncbi:MAG: hypothetical protein WC460_06550 [Patescibacteria group bacterium]